MGQEALFTKFLRILGNTILWFVVGLLLVWAGAALYFDFSYPSLRAIAAIFFALIAIAMFLVIKQRWLRIAALLGCFALVVAWWFSLQPSDDRAWQADVDRTAWAETNGDQVTLHNVRNCDYRAESDYTCQWEIKTVDLSQIRGIDLFFTHWGSPWIAHPILSFQFGDKDHIAFSIETRKEIGESYSAIRGFFRQYELIYTIAEERDVVRLRTNYRTGEEVSLYHIKAGPNRSRAVFLQYIKSVNELHGHPEWYNALTSNCTTNLYEDVAAADGTKQNAWASKLRIPLNGKDDEKAYARGAIAGNLPFPEMQRRALINPAAKAADHSPDFSILLRKDRPGFEDISNTPTGASAPN